MDKNSIGTIQNNIENLSNELEKQFCEAIGTEIHGIIRDNDTENFKKKLKIFNLKKCQ